MNRFQTLKDPSEDLFNEFMSTYASTPRGEGVEELVESPSEYDPELIELERQRIESDLLPPEDVQEIDYETLPREDSINQLARASIEPKLSSNEFEQESTRSLQLQQPDKIQEILNMRSEEISKAEPSYEQQLREAQERKRKVDFGQHMLRGAGQIASGIIGSGADIDIKPVDTSYITQNVKDLQAAKEKDIETAFAQAFHDPNSPISEASREKIKKSFPQLAKHENFDQVTAAQLQKLGIRFNENEMDDFRKMMALERLEVQRGTLDWRRGREGRMYEQFDYRKEEKFEDDIQAAMRGLRQRDPWKDTDKVLSNLTTVRNLIDDASKKGGQSLAMLGPKIAKGLAGEVGVLTEMDVTRYVQNPTIVGSLNDTIQKLLLGQLSGHSTENLIRLADVMEQDALVKRDRIIREESELFARRERIPFEEAYNYLRMDNIQHESLKNKIFKGDKKDLSKEEKEIIFPIQVRKDGKVATVSNEKELEEAKKEGWK